MARFLPIFLFIFGLPAHAFAGVSISEIAWMGTEVSASNEWIELFNDTTQPVSLGGWTLKAKDGSPSITLSGAIPSGGYFLIERTDDESVPTVPADFVATFGKGLSNEGETLDLRDASGTIIDTVKGGVNWKSIGGDAKLRLTAQKRGTTWVTAKATPKAPAPVAPPPSPPTPKKVEPETSVPLQKDSDAVSQVKEIPKPVLQKVYEDIPESEEDTSPSSSLTTQLLATLLLLGGAGVMYLKGRAKTEAEKYEIIEDDSDREA